MELSMDEMRIRISGGVPSVEAIELLDKKYAEYEALFGDTGKINRGSDAFINF